jgi:hypothetical protein
LIYKGCKANNFRRVNSFQNRDYGTILAAKNRNNQAHNHQKNFTMKKLLLLPLFFLGSMAVSKAQAPVTSGMETKNGPVMTFEVLEYNFGAIKQGESVTHEFKFKNTGREPLIINNAVGSCGCTVPDYPKEPIKPNGTGTIKVTFNSAGKMGQQDKTVTLTYDTDKTIVLHIKGNVEATATPATGTPGATPPTPQGGTTAPKATGTQATTTAPKASTTPSTAPKSSATSAPTKSQPATVTASPAPAAAEKPKH